MRQILAEYDNDGIYVYQAFKRSIVDAALAHGTFSKGFSRDRMTWIKPSFGWMLHRSAYATAHRQEAILKIKLSHEGFLTILDDAVPTSYDRAQWDTQDEWRRVLKHSEARYQWDPDRDLHDHKLEQRAIQIGIRGSLVHRYVDEWILQLEDVTPLAHAIHEVVRSRASAFPEAPTLQVYAVSQELQHKLQVDG